eukprot:9591413-Prorocentrum_lima.AAC.1
MTSSLVGSEMCIRDSLFVLATRLILSILPVRAGGKGASYETHSTRSSACLLYTSDAADDM